MVKGFLVGTVAVIGISLLSLVYSPIPSFVVVVAASVFIVMILLMRLVD